MLATKGKQSATKAGGQLEQARAKAQSAKGGLAVKADLDASFVPFLLGTKADERQVQVGGQPEGKKKKKSQPEGKTDKGGSAPVAKTAADPSAVTESVTDATYQAVQGEAFIEGQGEKNAADPSDVKQGSLGNCYLMAGLAAIANTDPDLLKNMVQDNGDGTYTVSFYLKEGRVGVFSSGSKVSIRVTNQFPMRGSAPAFSKTGDQGAKGPELWVMLIEKAWAIHQGSYEESRGSKTTMDSDVMAYMTGKQSRELSCSGTSESELLKSMYAASSDGQPMTASMPAKDSASADVLKAAEEKGLYFNHAYTVMTVDQGGQNIILRNPWGSHDPKPMTTADVKKIFRRVQINAA